MKHLSAAFAALSLLLPGSIWAESSIITPTPSFTANDILTGSGFYGSAISVQSGVLVGFDGFSLQSYDLATQNQLFSIALPDGNAYLANVGSSVFNSFVRIDPLGTSAWLGFTNGGNTDDRIFQVDFALQTWTLKATLKGNSDLRFFDGDAYVSGLYGGSPSISLLDTSGANNHDVVLSLSGNSAGFDFDSAGNLYYATNTYPETTAALVKFTSAQIASGLGAGSVPISAATLLSDLGESSTGAYNVAVDGADHVFFSHNAGFEGLSVGVWNGTAGVGLNYTVLALAEYFLTVTDTDGDVLGGTGALYQSGYGGAGVAQIKIVPEPSSGMLLVAGLLCFGRSRRRP
jgi:hypothetical protein